MTEVPYGITTYCDDIRTEVGGKLTFVGCYLGDMTVFGVVPVALPVFCAFVSFRIPASLKFKKAKIILSMDCDSEVKELARAEFELPENGGEMLESLIASGQFLSINVPIKLTPLLLEKEGFVRCRAFLDESEYKLGSLRIIISDPANMDPALNSLTPVKS